MGRARNERAWSTRPDDLPPSTLTIVVLTYNESMHIQRCIRRADLVADEILVVDSYSSDRTVELAESLGARVLVHPWLNYASQLNWALQNGGICTDWVMRLDADEVLDDELVATLKEQLACAGPEIGGLELDRRIRFLGQEIRHGGMAPMWVTRIWREGWAHCESRWMDEHMVLDRGRVARARGSLVDDNLNSLTWWTDKHNRYASREALDLLSGELGIGGARGGEGALNDQARAKRWLKTRAYSRLPLGVRAWVYYAYRMVLRLGVLDGRSGIAFHTLQGLWYRLLVDAKILEVRSLVRNEGKTLHEAVGQVLDIDPDEIGDSVSRGDGERGEH